jgi:hypothetical protein
MQVIDFLIEQTGKSQRQLAKDLGVTRQNLPRMAKAERLPFCVKLVFALLDAVSEAAREEAFEMIRRAPWPPKKDTTPKPKPKRRAHGQAATRFQNCKTYKSTPEW